MTAPNDQQGQIMNDDRQLNRGPRAPLGASSVLILAATASASATFPSAAECGCPTSSLWPVSCAGVGQLIHQRT
jgi:CBS-domain-containing membrane protein